MALIYGSTRVGSKYAQIEPPLDRLVWMGLVSQAGVTLGLTLLIAGEFPDWGGPLQTLMVSLIAIHQLIGPVLFRAALSRTGEVGRGAIAAAGDEEANGVPVHAD